MGQNRQKPYFSADKVESLMNIFKQCMARFSLPYDDYMVDQTQKYIVRGKSAYENSLLRDVLDGKYTFTVVDGLATFSVVKQLDMLSKLRGDRSEQEATLHYALDKIARFGGKQAGEILPRDYKPVVVVAEEPAPVTMPAEVVADAEAQMEIVDAEAQTA